MRDALAGLEDAREIRARHVPEVRMLFRIDPILYERAVSVIISDGATRSCSGFERNARTRYLCDLSVRYAHLASYKWPEFR